MLHLKRGFTGHSLKLTWVFSSVEIQRRQATSYQKAQFYSPVKTCRFIKIQKLFLLLAGIWPVNRKKTERTKVLGLGPLWMFNQSWLCSAGRCYVQYENSTPPPPPPPTPLIHIPCTRQAWGCRGAGPGWCWLHLWWGWLRRKTELGSSLLSRTSADPVENNY